MSLHQHNSSHLESSSKTVGSSHLGVMNPIIMEKLRRYEELKAKRQHWLKIWQLVGEYVHTLKQNFIQTQEPPGQILNSEVFDTHGRKSNVRMSSMLIGMLWPNGGKSFRLNPVKKITKNKQNSEFYEEISRRTAEAMDDSKAGMTLAQQDYMIDQGAFGTSGIGVWEGDESDLIFTAFGVQNIVIDEGKNGRINTVFIERKWTLRKIIEDYGIENVSFKMREAAAQKQFDEKFKVIIAIEPRFIINPTKLNNLNMPWSSIHFEMEGGHVLREKGFQEMPIMMGRFFKNHMEVYGRSPGMDALPEILELNAVREARMLAQEKTLDPPLGIISDSKVGGNRVDTSAGAINVVKVKGQVTDKSPIFPLFTVGDLTAAKDQIEELKQSVSDHFFIDRLLDFNNTRQMTLGEAQLRDRLRGQSLGSLFSRQIKEVYTPLIERSVNVLFRLGRLGVIKNSEEARRLEALGEDDILFVPDEVSELMLAGENFYEIKYHSPAARLMEAEEAEGIVRTFEFASGAANAFPEILDNLDPDEALRRLGEIFGAPISVFADNETVNTIRQVKQQQLEQQQQLEAAKQGGQAAKDISQAQVQSQALA